MPIGKALLALQHTLTAVKTRFSMTTLKERRDTDRRRQQKWRKHQQELGKKQISAMISLKSQILLNREKQRSGESTSEIIERALSALVSSH